MIKQKQPNKQIEMSEDEPLRPAQYPIDPQFTQRWSPRSFDSSKIDRRDLLSMIEAARWAPSCFNEQPWTFYISNTDTFDRYLDCLTESNQVWAKNASRLGFLTARRKFTQTKRENHTAPFDCGNAWMSFSLQAQALGITTRAMAGFRPDIAYSTLELDPDDAQIVIAFAIGRPANKEQLPFELQLSETPSQRLPVNELLATEI